MGAFIRRSCLWQVAVIVAVLVSPHLNAAEPPPRSKELKALFQAAEREAIDHLNVYRAREIWAQIYQLEPSTMALCQLGVFDTRIGHWDAAAVELSQCVERMPPPKDHVERRRWEVRHADLARALREVAELHIFTTPGVVAARILVDGREVADASRVYVMPGHHEIVAMAYDGRIARVSVEASAGESQGVPFTFENRPAAAVAGPLAPTRAALPEPAPSGVKPWIIAGGATITVGLLVTGLGLHVAANSQEDEQRAALCASAKDSSQDRVTSSLEGASTISHLGTASLTAGTLVGVATLVYVIVAQDTEIRARPGGAEVKVRW
jgi:hypothetical protein